MALSFRVSVRISSHSHYIASKSHFLDQDTCHRMHILENVGTDIFMMAPTMLSVSISYIC